MAEQYQIYPNILYEDITHCIENYPIKSIFIREIGSQGGRTKVREDLEDKTISFKQKPNGLSVIIDNSEVFMFEQNDDFSRNFSLYYERFPGEDGVIHMLPTGIDPDDPTLPPVKTSSFRGANMNYFIVLSFEGNIPLAPFPTCETYRSLKYWCVNREK